VLVHFPGGYRLTVGDGSHLDHVSSRSLDESQAYVIVQQEESIEFAQKLEDALPSQQPAARGLRCLRYVLDKTKVLQDIVRHRVVQNVRGTFKFECVPNGLLSVGVHPYCIEKVAKATDALRDICSSGIQTFRNMGAVKYDPEIIRVFQFNYCDSALHLIPQFKTIRSHC